MGINREALSDGKVFKALMVRYMNEKSEKNYFAVLQCLRDSFVWIPVTINMNEEDLDKFTNSKVGDKVTTEHDIKFEPDILQHGTTKFFPVFSSIAEMGDYGNHFSKVEKHFLEVMSYAMAKEETVGIVVNAFSTPFIVPKELFEAIGQMTSNIDE